MIVAYMVEGQLWCPEHCSPSDGELADGYVTPITQFDLDCWTPHAEWLPGSCCHSGACSVVWDERGRELHPDDQTIERLNAIAHSRVQGER